ncbi:tubulin folding cofactor D C terminal-domain-containing protein [Calycina marina]|uniref:Tubulin folding cofactor D C terminal-domain-containing protein n=1 Tax=Calycina marina TaxID=1763456 RepID=A0A9P7YX01_9HELO|nr:tubulin folding cofactor D C terminal-domain-containing protein [Calycina marina]
MDVPEDADLQVQRASPDLIVDLHISLEPFLWRTDTAAPAGVRTRRVRRRVRAREADRIVALLEPFQELPQLLDPHLQTLVPILADAFIASLQSKPLKKTSYTKLLIPLSKAICRLLYTFCKIRGEKVIVRFLSTDTKHLELLLSAIEAGDVDAHQDAGAEDARQANEDQVADQWEWEHRYITLLWLSQLLLAPFDLSTLSSLNTDVTPPAISGLLLPTNTPGVTLRVVSLALRYLSSSGKERDAAKILLVRIAMRRDMQALGLLDALIKWSIASFDPPEVSEQTSSYHYIGVLSFLSGILNASLATSDMDGYLGTIFRILQGEWYREVMDVVNRSVVARKAVLTVLRNICVIVLRSPEFMNEMVEVIEITIGTILESLTDSATPVRLAASKSLSVITLKLPTDMATQVVDEVLASLMRDVTVVTRGQEQTQNLSLVNPSEWHGLILTLSQLLYRRSPPASSLCEILPALLAGLSFEQRSTSGASLGTNVRDAACFGIWAIARRYTTSELQAINISKAAIASKHGTKCSILQILATELVVTASLDPAGNIRRGSSAALQELIGRHPNTIEEGIKLVQVVDYHVVALRSRAITEVAVQASRLSIWYLEGILNGLLGWRGIGDPDASARRTTAVVYGNLANLGAVNDLITKFSELKPREDHERHGMLLCVASYYTKHREYESFDIGGVLQYANDTKHRRVDLIAEAVSRLIISVTPTGLKQNDLIIGLLNKWLRRTETEVIEATAEAAFTVVQSLSCERKAAVFSGWIAVITENQGGRSGQDQGILSALFQAFPVAELSQGTIVSAIHRRWNLVHDVESRAAILRYLTSSTALTTNLEEFSDLIIDGLDDYTTTARGDVGSLVRIEALKSTSAILKASSTHCNPELAMKLYSKTLRLAAEKLDKVRVEAQQAVSHILSSNIFPSSLDTSDAFLSYPTTSEPYFRFILNLCFNKPEVHSLGAAELLSGYVGSANTGSEELVRASRAALVAFCLLSEDNSRLICGALVAVLKVNLTNDRVLVPTLEAIAFLFDMQIFQDSGVDWKTLHITVQKSHFKTGNIRKLEAAIHVYGGLGEFYAPAIEKLTTMAIHPFPRVRERVVDTMFVVKGVGKGVNWPKAGKLDLLKLK